MVAPQAQPAREAEAIAHAAAAEDAEAAEFARFKDMLQELQHAVETAHVGGPEGGADPQAIKNSAAFKQAGAISPIVGLLNFGSGSIELRTNAAGAISVQQKRGTDLSDKFCNLLFHLFVLKDFSIFLKKLFYPTKKDHLQ